MICMFELSDEELVGHKHFLYQFTANTNELVGQYQVPAVYFRWDMVRFHNLCVIIFFIIINIGTVDSIVYYSSVFTI